MIVPKEKNGINGIINNLKFKKMKKYNELTVIEKIYIKQVAMKKNGKRLHYKKPNYLSCLNELQIITLLSE